MNKEFRVSKPSPIIKISVTRDSVCAGDDVDAPHEKFISVAGIVNTVDFIREIMSRYSLPLISGGQATWMCQLNEMNVAVVAQQWPSPKAIIQELSFTNKNALHFKYHAQEPPENFV